MALCSNLSGIRVSAGIQVALAIAIGVILFVASVAGISHAEAGALSPFAPHGLSGSGRRQSCCSSRSPAGRRSPTLPASSEIRTATCLGLLSRGLGLGAVDAAAAAALAISLGTTNEFVASVSRLAYALAREDWLPRPIRHLSRRDVPTAGAWLITAVGGAGLVVAWVEGWGTQQIVLVPATLVLGVYLIATASAVKLIHGPTRTLAAAALVLTACAVRFSFGHLLVSVVVTIAALGYRRSHLRRLGSLGAHG